MEPNSNYIDRSPDFWAFVRVASEKLGYSLRGRKGQPGTLKHYKNSDILKLADEFSVEKVVADGVCDYMNYRADVLVGEVSQNLMNKAEAASEFLKLKKAVKPECSLPMNKQTGRKRHEAYFTCIINMLTEIALGSTDFVDNPGQLATIKDSTGRLIGTLSRRIDGAYPTLRNPRAIWEVKEYYGTTTFGSRVADGVYETLLDGFEINEAEKLTSERVLHYLLVDDHYTWWVKGRSYLCRLIDAMHMHLVDEVIFGREVFHRWPAIVKSWDAPKSPS